MKLLHNANNNIEWGAPISRLRQGSNASRRCVCFSHNFLLAVCAFLLFPPPVIVLFVLFLHIGLSFICLFAHSAHCAILIRCDIVKSDAIFFILFSPFLHIFCAPPVQWVQLLRFLFVASIDMP